MFRGRKADLLKIVFWDGTGLCLFTKRLEQSRFFWPVADEAMGSVMLTSGAAIDVDRGHRLALAGEAVAACSGRLTAAD